jgi:hypothetical protein
MNEVDLKDKSLKWLTARVNLYEKKLKKLEEIMRLPSSGHSIRRPIVSLHRQPKNVAKTYRVEIFRVLEAIEKLNY